MDKTREQHNVLMDKGREQLTAFGVSCYTKGKASFTVDCKYDSDKQIWEPENNAMFELTLANTIIMK